MLDLAVRLAILLGIFASVFLMSQVALGTAWRNRAKVAAINTRLRMIRIGAGRAEIAARLRKNAPSEFEQFPPFIATRLREFQRMFFAAALPLTIGQAVLAMALVFLVLCAILLLGVAYAALPLTAGVVLLVAVLAGAIAFVLPYFVVGIFAQRRRKRMEQQFPVAIDIFVRALRSGHPVASAIDLLTQEMEDPIGSEFGLVSDEVSYGAELTDALDAMAERWDLEDIRMFVVSLSVQIETGGNLAEILENLADVIRARASLYLKVRALSSEGRMTGWILSVLPIVTFVGMFMVNPRFYLDVARDSIFLIGFPSLIALYFLGVFWIRKLVDIKV
ncbi:MAG TPA: type II secretion system F family protein [Novosphingobium sp.]|nr:type II secretion system F family protein [Novosphingobium sp.]